MRGRVGGEYVYRAVFERVVVDDCGGWFVGLCVLCIRLYLCAHLSVFMQSRFHASSIAKLIFFLSQELSCNILSMDLSGTDASTARDSSSRLLGQGYWVKAASPSRRNTK